MDNNLNDLTFITNDENGNLKDRFRSLVRDTRFFDVLVGYFYTSGFYEIYEQLEDTEKIRILIGISTNQETYDAINRVKSHKEIKDEIGEEIKNELEDSENSLQVEKGLLKFTQWIKDEKLEIRAYPDEKIHSKLYIMTFNEDDRDLGRVITGSSNFTKSGLIDNLEFNVELKNSSDHSFAQNKFNELWSESIELNEKYLETIENETWIKNDITPYELYLKFLYEYFKEDINEDYILDEKYRPKGFKKLKYQEDAVINAKKIVEEYGGVFLSDVVGLGKTFMGTMLCQEIAKKTLVLAPPHLIDKNNKGSWENAFEDFGFRAKDYKCYSIGVLDKIIEKKLHHNFDVVLIDEAHRFRTEDTATYAKLSQICRGKKVVLVSATPYNNSPKDLLSQIKLFQKSRQSTIPNLPDIESFFNGLERRLKNLDRREDKDEYLAVVSKNSKKIRNKVLKYLMVRRTRKEIQEYYGEDLHKQKMSFPKVSDPKPIYYELSKHENKVFFETIEIIVRDFKYARYTPFLYKKGEIGSDKQRQDNMRKFMKMLLIKRLESSFHAFKMSLSRFISSYEQFINEYYNGNVYVSKKHSQKVFEYLESGDNNALDRLTEQEKAEKYKSTDFNDNFIIDLQSDLDTLNKIKILWQDIKNDPKILAFKEKLSHETPFIEGKSIIFTESKETAEYLTEQTEKLFPGKVIYFSGESSKSEREIVMDNFDASADNIKNDYKILITTDVLSEGANLHQANLIVNYDIPWNPTKVMQRVGRINRVDTKHEEIYTYTFFPTEEANEQIKLQELAEAKVQAFISLLGADAKLLTENEVPERHSLFSLLLSRDLIEGEDTNEDSELKYLQEIRKIRDDQIDLFDYVKKLPKKARVARQSTSGADQLLTYFRKGRLQKFYISSEDTIEPPVEIDFIEAAKKMNADPEEKPLQIQKEFYQLLKRNMDAIYNPENKDEIEESNNRRGLDNSVRLLRVLKSKDIKEYKGFTPDDEYYLDLVISELDSGGIPKKITQNIYSKIVDSPEIISNPLKLIGILKKELPDDFLGNEYLKGTNIDYKKEIILSGYFIK
jgi:superfamily II DNA or RNA helicase